MIIPVLVGVAIVTVLLTGGRLGRMAEVRVRWFPLVLAALAVQIVIIEVVPHWPGALLAVGHLGSYVMAAAFVVLNWRIPGLVIIGAGGMSNFVAIAANGGVMPASPAAVAMAGHTPAPGLFENSAVIEGARLWFLGDVFAIPAGWPFANVFSVGDVLIVVGAFIALHRICGTWLVPPSMRWQPPTAPPGTRRAPRAETSQG
jgi:hypothetical protein